MEIRELRKLATQFRIDVLYTTHRAQSGHVTSALSCIELLTLLYFGQLGEAPIMRFDPSRALWEGRDHFVLSKWHGVPALYVMLAHLGFFPHDELRYFRQVNAMLQGHPVRRVPGIDATIGELGQGLSIANGIALSLKMDKKPNRVYTLLGDGELQSGQIWEAVMTAATHKLDNLIAIVDNNKMQQTNFTRAIKDLDPIGPRFSAFGWNVVPVRDGHSFEELHDAMFRAWKGRQKPTVIIADTVKGKGVPFAENKAFYHGKALSDEEMHEALKILERGLSALETETSEEIQAVATTYQDNALL
ncbi:transketolase [Candidatus Peregrinibacteria bacterium CG11_big_fil_rev_8_21_14_0_20_46_8]|nr:MAG: transketolase [Candidatus Peregrinibacteria bacterium CG11_big_fil_rev_8_21_14_0_20_46_8]